jgi:DNA-binding SARP family transcriptional activator/TolB-like protein
MDLVLKLFGGFRLVHQNGEPIILTERARALLAYLAVAQSFLPRQTLAELLSEAGSEQEQRTCLRQAIYLLRKATGENIILSSSDGGLQLNAELVEADVHLFKRALTKPDCGSLQAAVEIYEGPFLDGVKSPSSAFEEWLQARRAEYLEHVLETLLKLASLDAAAGSHASALAYARRALILDPLREDAHRLAMRSLAALGQRANALRQYETARQLLAHELGVTPEEETIELHDAIAGGSGTKEGTAQPIATDRDRTEPSAGPRRPPVHHSNWSWVQWAMVILVVAFPLIAGGTAAWYAHQPPVSNNLPSIVVLPFTNGKAAGDSTILAELTTMLSAHPGVRVVSFDYGSPFTVNAIQRYRDLTARYVLESSMQKSPGRIQVMVHLIEAATGHHLWAVRLEESGEDTGALEKQIAYDIYESLSGLTGEIERHEQRLAWSKSFRSLNDYDYARRGDQFFFQFTREAHAKALRIYKEGLARYPDSTMLRLSLSAHYRHAVEVGWSADPKRDLETAWQLGQEASLAVQRTREELWVSHWMMAKLAQWCKEDFERSIAEAKSAIKLNPYDSTSRADLAELMANAGKTQEAIEWLQDSIRRDAKGPEWYKANLAWAYYLAGHHEEALTELQKLNRPRLLLLAAVYIRLDRSSEARAAIAEFINKNPAYRLADAARWPLIASLKQGWLKDLREAGLAENYARRN